MPLTETVFKEINQYIIITLLKYIYNKNILEKENVCGSFCFYFVQYFLGLIILNNFD